MVFHGAVEALKCCELTTSVTPERSAGAVTPCMLTGIRVKTAHFCCT